MSGKPFLVFKKYALFLYEHTEGMLLFAFAAMLVTDVFLGILSRFVQFNIVFATELGKYLFIWLCAIGIAAAAKDNQHVRINFIAEKLPVNRKIMWILSQSVFLVFSVTFFVLGIKLTLMHIDLAKTAMGFNFPMYVFTAALPVGFGLTSLRLIINIIQTIKGNDQTPWDTKAPNQLTGIQYEE